MKIKPFHEEISHTYEVEMYAAEDIAKFGETAYKERYTLYEEFNLIDIKNKTREKGYDSFEILETQYTSKHYSVE